MLFDVSVTCRRCGEFLPLNMHAYSALYAMARCLSSIESKRLNG